VPDVLNHPGGRGARISLLALPSGNGHARLAVAIEADTRGLARAARLLASMAQPGQPDGPAEPSEPAAHLGEALGRLVTAAEDAIGVPIPDMSRSQKQRVVKYLDDRGAFLIKKAVEDVAVRLGVSRFTIYNYLDEANRTGGDGQGTKGGS
jgi:predicted transcriptional regulator YheO